MIRNLHEAANKLDYVDHFLVEGWQFCNVQTGGEIYCERSVKARTMNSQKRHPRSIPNPKLLSYIIYIVPYIMKDAPA